MPKLKVKSLLLPPAAYDASMFTVDLITASTAVLDFLHKVKRIKQFDEVSFVTQQMREYLKFLFLQKDYSEQLIPSDEVQAVWLSHMLQSCPYRQWLRNLGFFNVYELHHPVTRKLDTKAVLAIKKRTQALMDERYTPTWQWDAEIQGAWESLLTDFTPEMVIYDRDWIVEFRKFTYGTDFESTNFLTKAHFGYQRFIYLKSEENEKVEKIGFSPCPSIDLMWHTHILHPSAYHADLKKAISHVPKHKLLALEDRTKAFMDCRDDESMNLWNKVFHESIFEYAVV